MHIEHLRHGARLLISINELAGERDLFLRKGRRPAEPDTLRLRGRSPGTGALMDQGSLELGNAGEERQHHAPRRRRGVGPWLGQRSQASLGHVQTLGDIEKVARRSGEAIKSGDHHHVADADMVEHEGELRPVPLRARRLFLIDGLVGPKLCFWPTQRTLWEHGLRD